MGRYVFTYKDSKGNILLYATSTEAEDRLDLGTNGLTAIGFTGKGCRAFTERCLERIARRRRERRDGHVAAITDTLYDEEKTLWVRETKTERRHGERQEAISPASFLPISLPAL